MQNQSHFVVTQVVTQRLQWLRGLEMTLISLGKSRSVRGCEWRWAAFVEKNLTKGRYLLILHFCHNQDNYCYYLLRDWVSLLNIFLTSLDLWLITSYFLAIMGLITAKYIGMSPSETWSLFCSFMFMFNTLYSFNGWADLSPSLKVVW